MNYKLENAMINNINLLIEYKLNTILEYAENLSQEEVKRINNYVKINVPKQINDYKIIKSDNKIIGCLLVVKYLDGILLDEIFIEKEYRNKKIGTNIIENILTTNNIVYLWVYKENKKAFNLYKKLDFKIIEETETRYLMKYLKIQ